MDPNRNNTHQPNSGLLRLHSAPTSLLENFNNGVQKGGNNTNNSSVSESFEDLVEGNKSWVNGFSQLPPHYPRQQNSGSNLMRQSSSPAGLFSHLTSQNAYGSIMKIPTGYQSGLSSSLGMLSQISEIDNENMGELGHVENKLGNGNPDSRFYGSRYPFSSWNDSAHFQENFSCLKRELDSDVKDEEFGHPTHTLSRHLSLPKNSAEIEKFLLFQDSVPCKIRAKRGCATHPRSIAERVRRTRISERMRKLQELVPNMDKQTNTADMLDLAVDYIKDLQKQFKALSENRANCKCANMQKGVSTQTV